MVMLIRNSHILGINSSEYYERDADMTKVPLANMVVDTLFLSS